MLKAENLGIIVQGRMASKRLPGKILMKIGDKTLLDHIFFRLDFLKHDADRVLATSRLAQDDAVEDFCKKRGIDCYRGSEENVLERYYISAKERGFRHIIRLTADNPFTDIEELDSLIDLYIDTGSDYANSFDALPEGLGAEIFKFSALERSYLEGKKPHHIEHVNEYMLENPGLFKTAVLTVSPEKHRPDVKATVDTEADYKKACFIVKNARDEFVTTQEIIRLAEDFQRRRWGTYD